MKKLTNTLTSIGLIAGTSLVLAAGSAQAVDIDFGRYRLSNHPDGGAAEPFYGLRLDELINLTPNTRDIFTFDFNERAGTEVFLDYDETGIRIHGTVFGGLVDTDNNQYVESHSSLWDLEFKYDNINDSIAKLTGDDDLVSQAPTDIFGVGQGRGTIISNSGLGNFDLAAYKGDNDYTFRFGDDDDNEGHRDFDGISGWGWLNHEGDADAGTIGGGNLSVHTGASDWLFTAELVDDDDGGSNGKVPEPTSILSLLALGTLGAGSMLKRKKNEGKIK